MSKSKVAIRKRKGRGFDISVCGRGLELDLKAKLEEAAKTLALSMMGAKICNTLTLKVTVLSNEKGVNGAVYTHTHESTSNIRAFAITLTKGRGLLEMVKTLAHELRHVEQFRRARFQLRTWVSDRKVHARWNGVEMGPVDSIPYYTRPWEVEARAESNKVSSSWVASL
jgi:hypothetical protein